MNTDNLCQQCSAPLSPADPQGLCPRCLLRAGIGSDESTVAMAGARRLIAPPAFPFDFGDYRVLRLLGRGGMGAVYEAERRDTGRRVALKVLGHAIDSKEMRRRFLREGRLAASVNHPNTVYIFGSEEIGGEPVIAMELIAGGTLRDSIRKGPLAVRDAVDATLQIIAGLEAAADAGVLHRDVKPENCFVAPDGTVKVGDFGLSVSTLARGDTQLTASGAMLGTPAFAPPEQLGGEDLDVRADIYSTGATLYALLTGRAPFTGGNAVHVVAAVLNKAPKPVEEIRSDVPAGLAQVVMRCLAKKREDRPASYAVLRDALLPFSSYVPEPAPVGMRMLAGAVDCLLATSVTLMGAGAEMTLDHHFLSERTPGAGLAYFGALLAGVAYFAIPEWLWGASIGKALCGLRVAPRGVLPVVMRALIVMLAMNAGVLVQWFISTGPEFKAMAQRAEWAFCDVAGPAFLFLLFVTMRRRNAFAAVHDLLTRTRVIMRPKANARPRLDAAPAPAPEPGEGERIGPFHVTGLLGGSWLAGYDDMLRRHVWIRTCTSGTPALPPARRDLGRAGRLRWIAGARDGGGWDAFDAPAGKPLAELTKQPWNAVRCWLLDLAEEIDAASADGTLPAKISTAHVWITSDGRAVILDEPRGDSASMPTFACGDIAGAQRFLAAVAESVSDRSVLPLHARDFTAKLAAAKFDRATFLIGNLRSLLAKPAAISRWRRFASLTAAPAVVIVFASVTLLVVQDESRREREHWASYPELQMLPVAAEFYEQVDGNVFSEAIGTPKAFTDHMKGLTGKYIAGRFGPFIEGEEFDRHPALEGWSAEKRASLRDAVRKHSPVTESEMAIAEATVRPALDVSAGDAEMPPQAYMLVILGALSLMGAVQFISLLVFGVTPAQRLFGFAVVNIRGEPAGRGRMLVRWAIIWLPFLLFLAFAMLATNSQHPWSVREIIRVLASGGIWFACVGQAVARPSRGVHDEIAGTSLVPR